jgi:hypothetical protein
VSEKESANCLAHGGNRAGEQLKKQELKNYRLDIWHAKVQRFGESNNIKSLRDEIGILRMLLEERLNTFCQTPNDLLLQSGTISNLIVHIEKLVTSCHKLEANMGEVLDRTALAQFAGKVIAVIVDIVEDSNQLEKISTGILNILQEGRDEDI